MADYNARARELNLEMFRGTGFMLTLGPDGQEGILSRALTEAHEAGHQAGLEEARKAVNAEGDTCVLLQMTERAMALRNMTNILAALAERRHE